MNQSVLNGKAGFWFSRCDTPDFSWRDSISGYEDTLTSTLFGLLVLLPGKVFHEVLSSAVIDIDDSISWLEEDDYEFSFWPRFTSQVEPDLVLASADSKHTLLFEMKNPGAVQTEDQIESEIKSAIADYPTSTVALIAVGGINAKEVAKLISNKGHHCYSASWVSLFLAVSKVLPSKSGSEKRILEEVIEMLNRFGFVMFSGFEASYPKIIDVEVPTDLYSSAISSEKSFADLAAAAPSMELNLLEHLYVG